MSAWRTASILFPNNFQRLKGIERDSYLKRDIIGRALFKRRYFLYRNWEWKLVFLAELDLLQVFNLAKDPLEKKNLLQEQPQLAGNLEKKLFNYLKAVEGKTFRSVLFNGDPWAF